MCFRKILSPTIDVYKRQLQDGDELDYSIDEKNGICNVLVTFSGTSRNLKVELTRKAGNAV